MNDGLILEAGGQGQVHTMVSAGTEARQQFPCFLCCPREQVISRNSRKANFTKLETVTAVDVAPVFSCQHKVSQ